MSLNRCAVIISGVSAFIDEKTLLHDIAKDWEELDNSVFGYVIGAAICMSIKPGLPTSQNWAHWDHPSIVHQIPVFMRVLACLTLFILRLKRCIDKGSEVK